MSKKYTTSDTAMPPSAEPAATYVAPVSTLYLDITLENNAVVSDIKRALKMIKGIADVKTSSSKKTGIEKGLEDIERGNVFYAKDSSDLIKQIFG